VAEFHADQRGLFIPCQDRRLYALDPVSGSKLWEPFVFKGECTRPIQLSEVSIYQYADKDALYSVSIIDGKQRWRMPEGRLVAAAMDGKVYVIDKDNQLRVVDDGSGSVDKTLPMTGMEMFARNTQIPAIYGVTADGAVYCVRKQEAGHLTTDMLE
jgi:outer membrane protein assembly factor BamB